MQRDKANTKWLKKSFRSQDAVAAKAVVIAIHADMFEFGFGLFWNREGFLKNSGFAEFAKALVKEANRLNKPVLLLFGDSHKFRMFRPFPGTAPMIMAVETFGSHNMHAVEISVDLERSFPFGIRPLVNPAIGMGRSKK